MIRTVVAFESSANTQKVSELLEKNGITVRYRCRTGHEVIRAIKKMGGGVVICGHKLPDMTADQIAHILKGSADVLVFAKPTFLDLCESEDIFRLPSPAPPAAFLDAVNMLLEQDWQRIRMQIPVRSKEEQELILKAKALIMEREGLSEEQAHRFMQKRSMETSSKMVEIAKRILSEFG